MKKMKKLFLVFVLITGVATMSFAQQAGSDNLYTAVEYSCSEFFPITIGLKIGIEKIYGHLFMAFDPAGDGPAAKDTALGGGVGSKLSLSESGKFFFNPELYALAILKESQTQMGLIAYFGYNISDHFSIAIGPSATWSRVGAPYQVRDPHYSLINETYLSNNDDQRNGVTISARAAVRYKF
jgi:hypothetical protein